ncbi:MAG: protein-tyrosine phosphatase [Desulfobacteraceae bacterium Eth-SRB2]|nr:MAG: protein-tyrosine phosphatase [Desulfobacteraceae bacterium Eth-SRB2]
MIDLHCHILPGLDDGPAGMEQSLDMAKQAVADGIQTLVATPHTLNEFYDNPLQHVEDNVNRLRKTFRKNRININVCTGSEVRICAGLKQKVIAKEVATLNNNGRYILVEFPVHVIPPGSKEELFQLKLHNITPILAHPERNLVFQHQPELLSDLTAMGCLVQITAMSITGRFGREAMECAHKLLKNRLSHVIATDAHSPTNRPPILSPAVQVCARILGSLKEAREMVVNRPQAILNGEPVKAPEPRPLCKKKWWFNWALPYPLPINHSTIYH